MQNVGQQPTTCSAATPHAVLPYHVHCCHTTCSAANHACHAMQPAVWQCARKCSNFHCASQTPFHCTSGIRPVATAAVSQNFHVYSTANSSWRSAGHKKSMQFCKHVQPSLQFSNTNQQMHDSQWAGPNSNKLWHNLVVSQERSLKESHLQMRARLQVERAAAYCMTAYRLACHVGSKLMIAAWRSASPKRYMSMHLAGCPSRPALPAHSSAQQLLGAPLVSLRPGITHANTRLRSCFPCSLQAATAGLETVKDASVLPDNNAMCRLPIMPCPFYTGASSNS